MDKENNIFEELTGHATRERPGGILSGDLAYLEARKESSRLKEKACENCMERLNGALSEEQMQQFREAFYTASEGHLFRESIPGQK